MEGMGGGGGGGGGTASAVGASFLVGCADMLPQKILKV